MILWAIRLCWCILPLSEVYFDRYPQDCRLGSWGYRVSINLLTSRQYKYIKLAILREGSLTQCVHCFSGGPSDQILDLLGPVLDAGGKRSARRKDLRKQVWTGNQVHISAGTRDQTRDSLVQSEGRYAAQSCFPVHLLQFKIWSHL